MRSEEIIELIEVLKSAGATHFKSREFEISLGFDGPTVPVRAKSKAQPQARAVFKDGMLQPDPEPLNPENTKRAEDLLDLLKRKDDQILDLMFPDGAEG